MLVACRLAGLSALEAHYAGVRAGAQCGAGAARPGAGSGDRTRGNPAAFLPPSIQPVCEPVRGNNAECRKSLKIYGRSERIRTSDPIVPNDVRYQAALHSDTAAYLGPATGLIGA